MHKIVKRLWFLNPFWVWVENRALRKRIDDLTDVMVDKIELEELVFRGNETTITAKSKQIVGMLAFACRKFIGEAPNFVEMRLTDTKENKNYIVTVQRCEGMSPVQLLDTAKLEIAGLKEQILQLKPKEEPVYQAT